MTRYFRSTNRTAVKKIIDYIKKYMHETDLAKRPYIIFLHPDDAKVIKDSLPEIEDKVIIKTTAQVEKGKGICVKREYLEAFEPHTILLEPFEPNDIRYIN
jgi:hypothetical protein